jgi:hypothetical protein
MGGTTAIDDFVGFLLLCGKQILLRFALFLSPFLSELLLEVLPPVNFFFLDFALFLAGICCILASLDGIRE